jgi:hypothetical protein
MQRRARLRHPSATPARVRPPQSPPLKQLAERQKHGDLDRLTSGTVAQVRAAFADGRQRVLGVLNQFAAAIAAEQQRLADLHGEEDASTVRVPLVWLKTSGWGARVRHALRSAEQSASQAARRSVGQGMAAAAAMGEQHARALLEVAMRPAVRAGMEDWTPKPAGGRRHGHE